MSRKWERMIEKNKKDVNLRRKKSGKDLVEASPNKEQKFLGRSIILPILLLSVAIFFGMSFNQAAEVGALYWVTVFSYLALSLYMFFVRRPYLLVGEAEIATKKLGKERRVPASSITKIELLPGSISIAISSERGNWVFTRGINRFDTDSMAERLEQFAKSHQIEVEKRAA